MNGSHRFDARSRNIRFAGFALLMGVLLLATYFEPRQAGGALLAATVFWFGIPLGSAALLAIHALTGGRWGETSRPSLSFAVSRAPLLALALIPIALFSLHDLYPWAANAKAVAHADVARYYLNIPAFLVRAVLIVLLSAFVLLVARRRILRPGLAAVALIAYVVAISFASTDWVMSLEPRWSSTTFGALVAISQLMSALAFCCVMRRNVSDATTSDLAQLLIATVLGVAYLGYMQFLVIWSGNLPDKSAYYVLRDSLGWNIVIGLVVLSGLVVPFMLLVRVDWRSRSEITAYAGGGALLGMFLLWTWQIGPVLNGYAFLWIVVATLLLGVVWLSPAIHHQPPQSPEPRT